MKEIKENTSRLSIYFILNYLPMGKCFYFLIKNLLNKEKIVNLSI